MGTPQPQVDMGDASGLGSRKRARNGGTSSASRRHIQTEQKRRDKINEGCDSLPLMAACNGVFEVPAERITKSSHCLHRYQELQKLLGVENIEKAQLLMQAADYTRQLQVGCQHSKVVYVLYVSRLSTAWLMSG